MANDLTIRQATDADKVAAFESVYSTWPCGDTVEQHVTWRLASPQHSRAVWYVGYLGEELACSLGAYPMRYRLPGRTVDGIAIGAVHTVDKHRGEGCAPQLIREVERLEAGRGAVLSMLFSDIAPKYYARMGYVQCPSHRLQIKPMEVESPIRFEPLPVEASESASDEYVRRAYAASVRSHPFAIERDTAYWDYVERKSTNETLFRAVVADNAIGFIRLGVEERTLIVSDYAFPGSDDGSLWRALPAALSRHASEQELTLVSGWCPESASWDDRCVARPREDEITMLKPLDPRLEITSDIQQACDALRFADHV